MRQLADAPAMISVYAHRYLPAGRAPAANPVLSIYQADIIIDDEYPAEWIDREFGLDFLSAKAGPRACWCRSGASSFDQCNQPHRFAETAS